MSTTICILSRTFYVYGNKLWTNYTLFVDGVATLFGYTTDESVDMMEYDTSTISTTLLTVVVVGTI